MVTVSNGVTVPKASMVSGISPRVTGATRTVCGGCARRPELSSRFADGAARSSFSHANPAAPAKAAMTTIQTNAPRRRRGAVSTARAPSVA